MIRHAAIVAALALGVGACSSGGSTAAPTTTTPSSTTAPTTSTTAVPAPTTTEPCAPAARPTSVVHESDAAADLDGDGTPDAVAVYGLGTADRPGPWMVSATAKGTRYDAPISDADPDDPTQPVRVLGVAASMPAPTIVVAVGTGASSTSIGLFQLVGCSLTRVHDQNGQPYPLAIGGSVTTLTGMRCDAGSLVVLRATSSDGETYATEQTPLEIAAGTVVPHDQPPGTASAADVADYGHLACPGVEPL